MLTERTITDKIEVLENGCIQVREATIVEKNGQELTRMFHRFVLKPGDDLTGRDQKVQDIANTVWTQEVIDAYQATLADAEILP